jgi:hypothetical protein
MKETETFSGLDDKPLDEKRTIRTAGLLDPAIILHISDVSDCHDTDAHVDPLKRAF